MSTTGFVRTQIGRTSAALRKQLAESKDLQEYQVDATKGDKANYIGAKGQLSALNGMKRRIDNSVELLDSYVDTWNEILKDLATNPTAYKEEETIFETTLSKNDFLELQQQGKEEQARLETCIGVTQIIADDKATTATAPGSAPGLAQPNPTPATPNRWALPKVKLPTFNGDPRQWNQFWESYNAAVHTTSMKAIEKFTYLIGMMEGEAKTFIRGFEMSENNYPVVIRQLTDKYGKETHIRQMLLKNLNNINRPQDDALQFKRFVLDMETIYRQLEYNGIQLHVEQLETTLETKLTATQLTRYLDRKRLVSNWNTELTIP